MTNRHKYTKRFFDIILSFFLLIVIGWFILILALVSVLVIRGSGFFKQSRIGQFGNAFTIYKIETLNRASAKVSDFGGYLRKSKLDELPQLYNVLKGDMSFVGPRPDLSGFADMLEGEDRLILEVKPGLTGPASLHYLNEEVLLSRADNPEEYNRKVIWTKKVELNLAYVKQYSFRKDLYYLLKTILFPKLHD